jgi:hypothetical protein
VDAAQSVPTQSRSLGIGTLLGSGTPTPGIEGRFSGGGDSNCDTPDASQGVTGSGAAGTPATAAADVPGTGGAGAGTTLAIDDAAPWTVCRTPGGVIKSAIVTGASGVGGVGGGT